MYSGTTCSQCVCILAYACVRFVTSCWGFTSKACWRNPIWHAARGGCCDNKFLPVRWLTLQWICETRFSFRLQREWIDERNARGVQQFLQSTCVLSHAAFHAPLCRVVIQGRFTAVANVMANTIFPVIKDLNALGASSVFWSWPIGYVLVVIMFWHLVHVQYRFVQFSFCVCMCGPVCCR